MITVDEAIKRQEEIIRTGTLGNTITAYKAMLLGIEALSYIRRSRAFGEYPVCRQLPGEPKDIKRGMTETMFINPERD